VLLGVFAVITGLKSNKISQTTLPERRGALQIIRIFTGFSLLAVPVLYAVFSFYGFELGKFQGNANLAAMIFAVPACLYFLFPGITDRFSEFLQTIFGICLIVFVVFSLVVTHGYKFDGLTSPIRACNLLSLVAMMLFVLYEIRFFAGIPMPNMYLACAGAALYFCATNGIPRLIATATADMNVSLQTIYACVETMIAIYAACRMILFLSEWKYTLQNKAQISEDLPQAVSLNESEQSNMIEPDYTEDSDIEKPLLAAEIDLELFDLAFSGENTSNDDLFDTIAPVNTNENSDNPDTTDPLSDDHLEKLLSEASSSCTSETTSDFDESNPSCPENNKDTQNNESLDPTQDAFDTLSNEMFGQ
jgi:hypothetical protein